MSDHITTTQLTDSIVFRESVESLLSFRTSKTSGKKLLRPSLNNKLICYVEDVHLSWKDPFGDQPAVEVLREFLTAQSWASPDALKMRDIEDTSFFACMATNAPESSTVS